MEPSRSALPCSFLQCPHVGAHPEEPASSSPAHQGSREKPVTHLPSVNILGSDHCRYPSGWATKANTRELLGLLLEPHMAYPQCQSLAFSPSALVFSTEPCCPGSRESVHLVQRT